MELSLGVVIILAVGLIGFAAGRSKGHAAGLARGKAESEATGSEHLDAIIADVERGRQPSGAEPGSPEARLYAALQRGWAPKEVERQAALREAIERVGGYLDARVRDPLAGAGKDASADELRERVSHALGALQDLDFFVEEMGEAREGANLARLAQGVAREFAADHEVGVRMTLGSNAIRAEVNAPALMDALYLLLHNASRFGGGSTVDVTVDEVDGRARVTIRDRGEGFSEEAFARAFDPFYSTSADGLGLGLPHARKVVEGMGGRIELRNPPDGGAEVEVSFPAA